MCVQDFSNSKVEMIEKACFLAEFARDERRTQGFKTVAVLRQEARFSDVKILSGTKKEHILDILVRHACVQKLQDLIESYAERCKQS